MIKIKLIILIILIYMKQIN